MSKLPRDLMSTGYSVAVIARPIGEGVLAHRPASRGRDVVRPGHGTVRQEFHVTACAGRAGDADEAYLVSAAWADHRGVDACPEKACFPNA